MQERRLAAVLVTDIVDFTTTMGADHDRALKLLRHSHQVISSIASQYEGELLEDAGDRSTTSFPSPIKAVECALEILQKLQDEPDLSLRIGIDLGEIIVSEGHVYGDAVIIASLVEQFADPNGIVITRTMFDAIHNKIESNIIDLGEKTLKHVDHAVRLYCLTGVKNRSWLRNFFSALMIRRVPHITSAYLAASWAFIEVADWLSGHGLFSRQRVYGLVIALIALLPSVLIISYTHGAYGKDRLTPAEKFGVPLNLVIAAILFVVAPQQVGVSDNNAPVSKTSVAVLPFINLGDNIGNEYFGMELSKELISSSLEGSVRQDGNQIRINAQLIDGEEDAQVAFGHAIEHAYLNREQEALDALELAINLVYPVRIIYNEPQFASLRDNERFIGLINTSAR